MLGTGIPGTVPVLNARNANYVTPLFSRLSWKAAVVEYLIFSFSFQSGIDIVSSDKIRNEEFEVAPNCHILFIVQISKDYDK